MIPKKKAFFCEHTYYMEALSLLEKKDECPEQLEEKLE